MCVCVCVSLVFSTHRNCVCRAVILILRTQAASLHGLLISEWQAHVHITFFLVSQIHMHKDACAHTVGAWKWMMLSERVEGGSASVTINEWRPNYCPNSPLETDSEVRHTPAPLWDLKQADTHTNTCTWYKLHVTYFRRRNISSHTEINCVFHTTRNKVNIWDSIKNNWVWSEIAYNP